MLSSQVKPMGVKTWSAGSRLVSALSPPVLITSTPRGSFWNSGKSTLQSATSSRLRMLSRYHRYFLLTWRDLHHRGPQACAHTSLPIVQGRSRDVSPCPWHNRRFNNLKTSIPFSRFLWQAGNTWSLLSLLFSLLLKTLGWSYGFAYRKSSSNGSSQMTHSVVMDS